MPDNNDFDVQRSEIYIPAAVEISNFDTLEKLPIYWGPNQLDTGYYNYNTSADWRNFEPLNIIKVVRFIFIGKVEYESVEDCLVRSRAMTPAEQAAPFGFVFCDCDEAYVFTIVTPDGDFEFIEKPLTVNHSYLNTLYNSLGYPGLWYLDTQDDLVGECN